MIDKKRIEKGAVLENNGLVHNAKLTGRCPGV